MAQQIDLLSNYLDATQAVAAMTGTATWGLFSSTEAGGYSIITAIDRESDQQTVTVAEGSTSPANINVTPYFLSTYTPEIGDIMVLDPNGNLRVLTPADAAATYTLTPTP